MTKRQRDALDYHPDLDRGPNPRAYKAARKRDGTLMCDNPECSLHYPNPLWNGQPAPLEIDHIDGAAFNSRTKNLRLLCANCHRQQPTSGGANKGRVLKSPGGYMVRDKATGKRDYRLMVEPGKVEITGGPVTLTMTKNAAPPTYELRGAEATVRKVTIVNDEIVDDEPH